MLIDQIITVAYTQINLKVILNFREFVEMNITEEMLPKMKGQKCFAGMFNW